jgi:hypothetical protein
VAEEFAPGIPAGRVIQEVPTLKEPKTWEFGVHRHLAERAGEHFDLRLGDPETGQAHSWALRYLPKPGEKRLAIHQPTHTVGYMDFKGRIEEGYGKGDVELAQRDKAEVISSSKGHVRFNVYRGKEIEEYLLRRPKPDTNNWLVMNTTINRKSGPGLKLPKAKPKYKIQKEEKIDVDNPDTELQAKIDGAHVLYHFPYTGRTPKVLSYRPAKRETGTIEHTPKLEGFSERRTPGALKDSVLRGELYAVDSKGKALPAARVGGILNANVWKSREKQKAEGKLIPIVFDVDRWKGQDVSDFPYQDKKLMLQEAVKAAPWLTLPRTATTPESKAKLIRDIQQGKEPSTDEGVVEWNKRESRPKKTKFLDEKDVVVRRIFAEAGKKRQGTMAGGFEFSLGPRGPIIGRVGTGFSHAMKRDMLKNPSKYEGIKARLQVQRAPGDYAPRSPSFLAFHLDEDLPPDVKTAVSLDWIRKMVESSKADPGKLRRFSKAQEARANKLLEELEPGAEVLTLKGERAFPQMPMASGWVPEAAHEKVVRRLQAADVAAERLKPRYARSKTSSIISTSDGRVGFNP